MQDFPILVLGANGLVGSALCRKLLTSGYCNILAPKRDELNLLCQSSVDTYMKIHRPKWVFLAAAKVGGILANSTYPAEFIYQNLAIATNVIHACYTYQCAKLLFLGSSCIYPKVCPIPIKEEYLLSAPLEKTNEAYAISKIAGLKMAAFYQAQYGCAFFSAMPTNLYGPNDNYHPDNSHVIPGLIHRIASAERNGDPVVTVWGTGAPMREFLYVDDLADGLLFLMNHPNLIQGHINIGSNIEISIKDLALKIAQKIGFKGKIKFDTSKPDGTLRKLLDSSKIESMGWKAHTSLDVGLDISIHSYMQKYYGTK